VSCYHFLIFCTVVLYITYIFVVFARINMAEKIVRLYGEEVDWRKADVDLIALYANGGGKSHGRQTDGSILILCLCNVMIYSYVIHIVGMPCLME
jgi:uncharacterized membrane protein